MWIPPDRLIKETELSPFPCCVNGCPSQKAERAYSSEKNPAWGPRDSRVSPTHLRESHVCLECGVDILFCQPEISPWATGHLWKYLASIPGRAVASIYLDLMVNYGKQDGTVVKIMWWMLLNPSLLLQERASFIQCCIGWALTLSVCFPTLSKTVGTLSPLVICYE